MLRAALSALFEHPLSTRAWRWALVVLLALILWLALTPAPPRQADLGWDKLNHLAAFGTLSLVAVLGRCGPGPRIALGLLAYGALIEVLQSFTPTRSPEWADLMADGLGIALGLPPSLWLAQWVSRVASASQQVHHG